MQTPSKVKTPCAVESVVSLSREIVDTARDYNNIFATGEIHNFVRNHYIDPSTGTYGIEALIRNILKANGSVFPMGIENTELRAIAISASMFTFEVIAKVRETFGSDRYPDATILNYLSEIGRYFGKVQLTGKEDSTRECNRPRCKWYTYDETTIEKLDCPVQTEAE